MTHPLQSLSHPAARHRAQPTLSQPDARLRVHLRPGAGADRLAWLDADLPAPRLWAPPDGVPSLPALRPASADGVALSPVPDGIAAVDAVDRLDGLLAPLGALGPLLGRSGALSPRQQALVCALNGLLGDHLLRCGHPLALPMQLRHAGQPLQAGALGPDTPGRLLLLVHGLGLGDAQWCRHGHDHGRALAPALQALPVHARYNSGLHVSHNGQALSLALQALADGWPSALRRIDIVGHGMGGLVARSALAQAAAAGHDWPRRVRALVCLGTPHQGLPMPRSGAWLQRALGLGPQAALLGRLAGLRSQGMVDLRHGNLLERDWRGHRPDDGHDHRQPVPVPPGVETWLVAGCLGEPGASPAADGQNAVPPVVSRHATPPGDGVVPVDSALGRHRRAALALPVPADHVWTGHGIGHLDLLSDPLVWRKLLGWLQG